MIWKGRCKHAGCGFEAKVGSFEDCANWLWHHEFIGHPMGVADMAGVKTRLVFDKDEICDEQGTPGSEYANRFKQLPAAQRPSRAAA